MALYKYFNVALLFLALVLVILGAITSANTDLLYGSSDIVVPLKLIFRHVDIITHIDLSFLFVYVTSTFIVIGFLVTAQCILGLYGVIKKNAFLLILYCIFSLLMIMLEIGLIVYIYMKSNTMESSIRSYLQLSMENEYVTGMRFANNTEFTASEDPLEKSLDDLQLTMQCCGVNGHNDWYHVSKWNTTYQTWNGDVISVERPPSCCRRSSITKQNSDVTYPSSEDFVDVVGCLSDVMYSNYKGCADVLHHVISRVQVTIGGVMLVLVLLQGMCVLLACCMRVIVDKSDNRIRPV